MSMLLIYITLRVLSALLFGALADAEADHHALTPRPESKPQ